MEPKKPKGHNTNERLSLMLETVMMASNMLVQPEDD